MDFYEAVGKRKTIRQFSSLPVDEEKIGRVLSAGLMAPTHNHLREWEFILLRDLAVRISVVDTGEELAKVVDIDELKTRLNRYDQDARHMYLGAIPVQRKMILGAPEVLIVCYRATKPIKDCTTIFELNGLSSAWCCIENILLAMAAEGLFGVTYVPQHTNRIREVLDIPEGYEVPVIIPFGYPAEGAVRCRQKETRLADKIHIDRW